MARKVSFASDYYAVLQVAPTARLEEIRASFKRLVLEAHPDKNPGRRAWSERRVRQLIEAFEILGNAENRAAFDRARRAGLEGARGDGKASSARKDEPFFFRKKDPEARALLILYLLLNRRPQAAIRVLEEMESRLGEDFLESHLEPHDYLDCLFLLGEFHVVQKDYLKAEERLRAFYRHERDARFPRHYLDQVVDLLKDLYLRKLPRVAGGRAAIQGLEQAAALGLSRTESLLRLKKMAEILLKIGDTREARKVVTQAFRQFPDSRDFDKIRRVLDAKASR